MKKNTMLVFFAAGIFLVFSYISGISPFVPSEGYLQVLHFAVSPCLVLLFAYRLFIWRNNKTGLSIYKQSLKEQINWRGRLKIRVLFPTGIPFIVMVFVLLAQFYPALPSRYFYVEVIEVRALVSDISKLRKTDRFGIYFTEFGSEKEYKVHWPRYKSQYIEVGTYLKLSAKQNWFGRYIDDIKVIKD